MARIYYREKGQKPKKQSYIRKNKARIWWVRGWASIAIFECLYIIYKFYPNILPNF